MSAVAQADGLSFPSSRWEGTRNVLLHLWRSPGGLIGAVLSLCFVVAALFGSHLPFVADPHAQDLGSSLQPPALLGGTWSHPLGTDQLGRDVLAQIIAGSRVSIEVGLAAVAISAAAGLVVGMIAGYSGGVVDSFLMGLCDVFTALPGLLSGLMLVAVFGPSKWMVILMIALTGWTVFARISRGYVGTLRGELFVEASRLSGARSHTVMRIHLLPNVAPSLVTLVVMEFAAAVLSESGYDFLGFGVQPPATSWGLMIAQGRDYVTHAWWIITFAGAAIALLVFATNLLSMWVDSYSNTQARDQLLLGVAKEER